MEKERSRLRINLDSLSGNKKEPGAASQWTTTHTGTPFQQYNCVDPHRLLPQGVRYSQLQKSSAKKKKWKQVKRFSSSVIITEVIIYKNTEDCPSLDILSPMVAYPILGQIFQQSLPLIQ